MQNKNTIYPSLEDVQALYSSYSTIANTTALRKTLYQHIDPSYISSLTYNNIREIYNHIILLYYHNEVCIKSEFINHILLKGKKHVTIFEFPIGTSRADLCKINGTSIAYEIKTDLDNLQRLSKQINDYMTIFDQIYVICSQVRVHELTPHIPAECGIYSYHITTRGTYHFDLIKKASNSPRINSRKQLQLLRKNELYNLFNIEPTTISRTAAYNTIINSNSSQFIDTQFKKALKNRYQQQWDFLKNNHNDILEIDYQWFFKNTINPSIIYNT